MIKRTISAVALAALLAACGSDKAAPQTSQDASAPSSKEAAFVRPCRPTVMRPKCEHYTLKLFLILSKLT